MYNISNNYNNEQMPKEATNDKSNSGLNKMDNSFVFELSQKKLQEVIIWSEIIGKPVSKRRKRR